MPLRRSSASPTRALGRAGFIGAVLLGAAVTTGRPDLAVLAAPFLISLALTAARSAGGADARLAVTLEVAATRLAEGLVTEVALAVATPQDLDVCVLDVSIGPGLGVVDGSRVRVTALRSGEQVEVAMRIRALHWGRRFIGPVVVTGKGARLALSPARVGLPARELGVHPLALPFAADQAVPYAVTPAGAHRSRLRGDGLELAGVRPFRVGDRLRRINWRVTQRTGSLHVNETLPERGTDVVIVLDTLHEAGPANRPADPPSSLDITVRAAAAIAFHYLALGDRVSLLDYGGLPRFLPPGGGSGQRAKVLEWLLDVAVVPSVYDAGSHFLSPRVLPPRSLVVALTPLLDERFDAQLAALRRRGQPLVVIDVLPDHSVPEPAGPIGALAIRVWRLERERLIAQLDEVGVPVVPWAGSGSIDAVLRDVSRLATAPRAVAR